MPQSVLELPGLELYLDAQDANVFFYDRDQTTAATDGGLVGSWKDLSGNGRHCFQLFDGNKPTFGAQGLNNLPALHVTQGHTMHSSIVDLAPKTKLDLWLVFRCLNTSSNRNFISFSGSASSGLTGNIILGRTIFGPGGQGYTCTGKCDVGVYGKKIVKPFDFNGHVLRGRVDFAKSTEEAEVWIDGDKGVTFQGNWQDNHGTFEQGTFVLGYGTNAPDAWLASVIALSEELSLDDEAWLLGHLMSRWSLG